MPIYESLCKSCGKMHEYIKPASQYLDSPFCCGERTQKVILNPPMGYVENIYYTSPIDGRPITTKQQRINDLKANNCRPWMGLEEERKEAKRRAAYDEEKQDKALEKTVVDAWRQLTPEKQAALSKGVV